MKFIAFEDILPEIEINLKVLGRGTERYRMLLYQHEGVLGLSEDETKLGNLTNCVESFRSFLKLAKGKNVDLAMTPEYSCPWINIREIIETQENWPAEGKLWALGAESITPQQLLDFEAQYNAGNKVVHFDKSRLEETGVFFDPIIYLFCGRKNDTCNLVILIQFKTHHMGARSGELERNRLIPGKEVYVLRNSNTSINLITVICSEAMNFPSAMNNKEKERFNWNDHPFLILNPQLNPNPIHNDFISFRRFLFEQERKEVISLNWNLNSKIENTSLLKFGCSRSGIFLNSNDVEFNNQIRIRKNHNLGLYYFYLGKSNHAFILNSLPQVYLIENLSVSQTDGVLNQRFRNGPEVMETYSLQENGNFSQLPSVSDAHLEYLDALGCKNEFLTSSHSCILEKERLVCLTTGTITDSTNTWSSPEKLFSFRLLENTEINNRLTFAEDTIRDSIQQRDRYIEAVNEIDYVILPNKEAYPESLADLKSHDIRLGYSQENLPSGKKKIKDEHFRYNLTKKDGEMINATICYVGSTTIKNATETYLSLKAMFSESDMNWQRIVVYYRNAGGILNISHQKPASYVNVEEKGPTSYLSE